MPSPLLLLSLFIFSLALSNAQHFFYHRPAAYEYQPQHYQLAAVASAYKPVVQSAGPNQYAHPSVIANSVRESQLPPELSKSARFYNNPRIAAALAKESWLTEHEMPVLDREAEKIPREMIYKIFKNAGWIKRR